MANVPSCSDLQVPLESESDGSRADRHISGSSSTATSDVLELKLASNKENACLRQAGNTTSRGVPEPRETPTANSPEGPCLPFVSALPHQSQSIEFRRPRLSCVGDIDDAITKKRIDIKLHDISQSRWIEDPNDHSMEKVYLTNESSDLEQMVTIDTSFCWTQVQSVRPLTMLTGDQSHQTIPASHRVRRFRGELYAILQNVRCAHHYSVFSTAAQVCVNLNTALRPDALTR